ncbi:MAG: glycosyltransferase family 2 protein [Clostridia bacterium]|nr:glycosyltransferase family 2 protein [Clostridia bacterium]MBR0537145.1 glycosyltransferase family 2 protein [Clostridia bacterium]
MPVCLYFVVPCYKDEDTLPVSVPMFLKKLDDLTAAGVISAESRLMLINDASPDDTWNVILELKKKDRRITAMDLAHNAGEQNALLAGMFTAAEKADCVITMDSDLQDDIDAVDEMLQRFSEGCEIVYGVRSARKEDGFGERFASGSFYALMRIAGTGQIDQHANFRLMSKKAIGQLSAYTATNYYLPCVVSNMGLKSAVVYHQRFERAAGTTGYSFAKKLRLAVDAVFSHSVFPLKLVSGMAAFCGVLTLAALVGMFVLWGKSGAFPTRTCILASVFLIGTLFMCALRILGEYIVKTFAEAKHPPRYRIDTYLE